MEKFLPLLPAITHYDPHAADGRNGEDIQNWVLRLPII